MKKRQGIVFINCVLVATIITALTIFLSCDVFMPNFLVGTWYSSGVHGNEKLVFTKDGDFTAQFYKKDGKAQKIAGKYKAGKASVQLRYKAEDGTYVKEIALYKMYRREMDFIFKGKKIRFYKF